LYVFIGQWATQGWFLFHHNAIEEQALTHNDT